MLHPRLQMNKPPFALPLRTVGGNQLIIGDALGVRVAVAQTPEQAAHLVACANLVPELVAALKFLIDEMPDRVLEYGEDDLNKALIQARAVLAKTKEVR